METARMTKGFYPLPGMWMPGASPMRTSSADKGSFITPKPSLVTSVSAGMKTILAATGLALVLLIPTGAIAKPDKSERDAAKADCRTERGTTKATRELFRLNYDGFADCMGKKAAEEEAENETAAENAAHECKAERAANPTGFKDTYGTNKNGKNAFGKCVSGKAAEKKAAMDAADAQEVAETKNAAKECAAERAANEAAFKQKYGTNRNDRNAFGKCVSGKTRGGS
jgi:hypothetical protein